MYIWIFLLLLAALTLALHFFFIIWSVLWPLLFCLVRCFLWELLKFPNPPFFKRRVATLFKYFIIMIVLRVCTRIVFFLFFQTSFNYASLVYYPSIMNYSKHIIDDDLSGNKSNSTVYGSALAAELQVLKTLII